MLMNSTNNVSITRIHLYQFTNIFLAIVANVHPTERAPSGTAFQVLPHASAEKLNSYMFTLH